MSKQVKSRGNTMVSQRLSRPGAPGAAVDAPTELRHYYSQFAIEGATTYHIDQITLTEPTNGVCRPSDERICPDSHLDTLAVVPHK